MRNAVILLTILLFLICIMGLASCASPRDVAPSWVPAADRPLTPARQELEELRDKALRAARWDIFALRRIARDGPDSTNEDGYLCRFACGLLVAELLREDAIAQERGE